MTDEDRSGGQTEREGARSSSKRLGRSMVKIGIFLVGVVAGVVLNAPVSRAVAMVEWHVKNRTLTGAPNCDDPGWYHELSGLDARSYSQYHDEFGRYTANNTTDNNHDTAWAALMLGNPKRDWIRWKLGPRAHVALICLRPGFTRDYTSYTGNARPRNAILEGCKANYKFTFPDHFNLRRRKLDSGFGKWYPIHRNCSTNRLHLIISSVYPA